MEKWQQELIQQVTSDPAFPSRDRLRHQQVLEYLADHSSKEDKFLRSEATIKEKFLLGAATPPNFIKRLAAALEAYFASEAGRRHTYLMEIPRGEDIDPAIRYAVFFRLNPRGVARHFWAPHLTTGVRTFVAYGVPLFARSRDQTEFVRYADKNTPESIADLVSQGYDGCWPFVAHGDLLAAMELSRWLHDQNVGVDIGHFKATDGWKALKQATPANANIIALGSTRVNGILADYQALKLEGTTSAGRTHLPFRLRLYDVAAMSDDGAEDETYIEERGDDDTLSVPVIVTRRMGAIRNSSITLIASNHGRAVQRMAEILTDEDELNLLFQDERLQSWRISLPKQFQILLRVIVLAGEDLGGAFSVVNAWP